MAKKLYKDALLTQPLMAQRGGNQVATFANDEDIITIGAVDFIRVTDASGNDVFDTDGKQLLLDDGIIYLLVDGVPESTNITVTDVEPPAETYTFTIDPTPADATVEIDGVEQSSVTVEDGTTVSYEVSKEGYITQSGTYTIDGADYTMSIELVEEPSGTCSLTVNVTNQELTDADIMIYDDDWTYSGTSSEGKTLTVSDIPSGTHMNINVGAAGYKNDTRDFDLTENLVLDIELVAFPKIALSSDLTASSEQDGVFIKDGTGTDYVLTDNGTKVLFSDVNLIEEGTNDAVFDSVTGRQIFINPFTASIETGMDIPSGYTLQSMPTGNIEFDMTNSGSISATTANLEVAASVNGYTSSYTAAPDSGTTSTISVAAGAYVFIQGRADMLYDSTVSGGDTVIENQTTTISATYEITKVDSGYANITFTNSGSITATTANLSLYLNNSLSQTVQIDASDIDNGSLSLELPVDSGCSIGISSVGSGYSVSNLSVQDNPFEITNGETTNVSVDFEITQDAEP